MAPPSSGSASTSTASSESQSPPQQESLTSSPPSEAPPTMKPPMAPPPPKNPNVAPVPSTADAVIELIPESENAESESKTDGGEGDVGGGRMVSRVDRSQHSRPQVPYKIPPWSAAPCHSYSLEVLKDGLIIDQLDITKKGAYMFGRADICDFVLENPTASRFHAVLQFNESGEAFFYDLGSSHGSFVNKTQVKGKVYVELHVGDVIRFGLSTRLYIFQGPTDLMPPETDIKSIKHAKYRLEKQDREASLRRARAEAALADGISWGMGEDAIEEDEDEVDEITWQTHKGELTEKQEKTRSKIAHMKKEMDAIRAKDISQGGLTQGQQTQIARNEQRISQLLEELESLEETLNDSIRESLGARTKGISYGKKKMATEDDEEFSSDEDDFYDRTKKKQSSKKSQESQSVETADTLLDKKEVIMKEMEEKEKLLLAEKNKISEPPAQAESGDILDAFMSGLSSQLKQDIAEQLEKQLSDLQTELDRVLYLLNIADPTGEAALNRQMTVQKGNFKESHNPQSVLKKAEIALPQVRKISKPEKLVRDPAKKQVTLDVTDEAKKVDVATKTDHIAEDSKPKAFTLEKPQWLGAVSNEEKGKSQKQEASVDMEEDDDFVGYNDRDKILSNKEESGLENAAPGLIIRKKKQVEESAEESTSPGDNGMNAKDAVALLLKHKRGYQDSDEAANEGDQDLREDNKRAKRVLGPEKPSFLNTTNPDYEAWVPPKGQSGDGRTSLNDRLGY
ncbi:hypothetical protein V2J09_023313 [Rumex salicifolius]